MGKIIKLFTILISLVLIGVAVFVAILAFPVFGNQALIVRSGSMEPNMPVGSVVVVRPNEDISDKKSLYAVGEVISFRRDANTIVTHRVVGVEESARGFVYRTKGDANEEADSWTVKQDDIIGKSYLTLPEFGKFLAFAKSKYGFPLLIIFPAAFVILIEFINIIREIRKTRRKSREEKKPIIRPLRFPDEGYRISSDSFFTKRNFYAMKVLIPFLAFGIFFQNTLAFFSDTETSENNYFQAASSFPSPSGSPTPTITPTPTGTTNLCDDIDVDISGNGVGSVNGIVIICENNVVVSQSNNTTTNTNINVNSNTGNNSNNGNTNGGGSTTTGGSSTNVNVTVSGGSNNNNSPTPTP